MKTREPRRFAGCGAPASLRAVFLVLSLALLAGAGCKRLGREGEQVASPADNKPSPRYIRVSVYLTDKLTTKPVADADVFIGPEQLLPAALPREYGEDPAGLYVTETLEGGTYLFRVRHADYRLLAGKLTVPPVPERIVGEEPPEVLEPEDPREVGDAGRSFRVMILWQRHKRGGDPGQKSPHPPMEKPPGVSPHKIITHPIEPQ